MNAIGSRLARLERSINPNSFARVVVIRGGTVTDDDVARLLVEHGERIGPNDILEVEQHGDPSIDPPVLPGEPLSLTILPMTGRFEDLLAELDNE